jgi:hypothetical protein
MLDRMAALGFINVFDVKEIGEEVLVKEIEMPPELAARVVAACTAQAEIVAAQQQREQEELAARKAAEEAAARAVLDGGAPVETDAEAESRAADILGGSFPNGMSGSTGGDFTGVASERQGRAGE